MSWFAPRHHALGQALRALARRPLAMLFALLLAALALWLPLAALSLAPPLAPAWQRLDAPAQAVVFVAPGSASGEISALRAKLAEQAHVTTATHVPRDAALAELARRAPGGTLPELKSNPLPDAIVVAFARGTPPESAEAAVAAMRKLARVDSVQYDGTWYRRWSAAAALARTIAAVAAAALLVLSVAAVAAAARVPQPVGSAELALLRLVGSSAAQRRRPFAYAGLLMGLGAGLLAVAALAAVRAGVGPTLASQAAVLGLETTWPLPPWSVLAAVVAGAAAIGGLSGSAAGRRADREAARAGFR
jgi:cell division transport system permease protein